jgi:hypothetical protein
VGSVGVVADDDPDDDVFSSTLALGFRRRPFTVKYIAAPSVSALLSSVILGMDDEYRDDEKKN